MSPHLKKLREAVLTLFSGNADVEKSLLVKKQANGTNTKLLTPESLMKMGGSTSWTFTRSLCHARKIQRLDERKKQEGA